MRDEMDVGHWLRLLRDGSESEQQLARTELGLILETRGMLDDAAEAYQRNVEDGVQDRRPYERLAALARQRGDVAAEARAWRALADVLSPLPASEPPPVEPLASEPLATAPLTVAEPADAESPDATDEGSPLPLPLPRARERGEPPPSPAHGDVGEADVRAAQREAGKGGSPEQLSEHSHHAEVAADDRLPDEPPPSAFADDARAPSDAPATVPEPEAADISPKSLLAGAPPPALPQTPVPLTAPATTDADAEIEARPPVTPASTPPDGDLPAPGPHRSRTVFSRWLATLVGLAVVILVVGGALMVPVGRPLPPAAPKPSPSPVTAPLSASAVSPTALPAVLPSPSPTPAPPTPVVQAASAPSPAVSAAPAAPLDARCADVALRFPESRDSEGAVRSAFREYMARQGVTIDPTSTLFAGQGEAYAARHTEVLAGWMAVTLQREGRGLPTFPLTDYVASDIIVAAGPGEYQLRATISPQGWNELQALQPTSCEGAFLKNPDNARWVDLMPASVGDITWALPTPQPRR